MFHDENPDKNSDNVLEDEIMSAAAAPVSQKANDDNGSTRENKGSTGSGVSTDSGTSTQGESEEMICFLKFYNYLNVKDKKAWKDDLKKNMSDVLLSVGCARIKHIIECLNRPPSDALYDSKEQPPEEWHIIYSHRHMGATSLLQAIKSVWMGEYEGEKSNYYYNGFFKKARPCKLVSFSNDKQDLMVTFLDNDLKVWAEKLPEKFNDNCPCEAVEKVIVDGIKAQILKYAEESWGTLFKSRGKGLLLLDDFDVHLCKLYKDDNELYMPHKIWFYRKCWIEAVLELNSERKDIAVVLVLLTKLMEYKKSDEDDDFGHFGNTKINYKASIFDLYGAYSSIIKEFKDACFFKIKPSDVNYVNYECIAENPGSCRFALSKNEYWPKDDGSNCTDDKRDYIRDNVLCKRHRNVNYNPWWVIVPLTHVMDRYSGLLYDDADNHLKAYYKEGGDGKIGKRTRGPILDEFFQTLPLYCQPGCEYKKLEAAVGAYKKIIGTALEDVDQNRGDDGNITVKLVRTDTERTDSVPAGEHRTPEIPNNVMAKTMLNDSGLVIKVESGNKKDDRFYLHPFVCYVYSTDEKYFEKEVKSNG